MLTQSISHQNLIQYLTKYPLVSMFLAGVCTILAFAPFNLWFLTLLTPIVFYFLVIKEAKSIKWALLYGFIFGIGIYGVGASWIYTTIVTITDLSGMPAFIFTVFIICGYSLTYALIAGFLKGLSRDTDKSRFHHLYLLFICLWVGFEILRGISPFGFTWFDLGYTQSDTVLNGFAPLLGVYGVSLLLLLSSYLIVLFFEKPKNRVTYSICFTMIFVLGYILNLIEWTDKHGEPIKVALVQDNFPQDTKWLAENINKRKQHFYELTNKHWSSDLIVWPENSMTELYGKIKRKYLSVLKQTALQSNTALVLGVPVKSEKNNLFYNSLVKLGQNDQFYYKRHLIPFGEYVPFKDQLKWLADILKISMSDFSAGSNKQAPFKIREYIAATSICYEDIFGEEIRNQISGSHFILNASNNAIFGKTIAQDQHFQISRMRAIETGRDYIRATVNGITATINHKGDVIHMAPKYESYVLKSSITPRIGNTPYVVIGNYGIFWILLILFVFSVIHKVKISTKGSIKGSE